MCTKLPLPHSVIVDSDCCNIRGLMVNEMNAPVLFDKVISVCIMILLEILRKGCNCSYKIREGLELRGAI